jgi:mono/diheme cytochrome c family protein
VAAGIAALLWLRGSSEVMRIDETDAALVARGRVVYAEACASCHGAKLEGQENWRERRPDGKLPAPPHDASGHTWHHPDAMLFRLTREGLQSVLPGYQSDMPAFAGTLPDRDILASLAYIKSAWPPGIRSHQAQISRQAP